MPYQNMNTKARARSDKFKSSFDKKEICGTEKMAEKNKNGIKSHNNSLLKGFPN